jgi:hypothetical protein
VTLGLVASLCAFTGDSRNSGRGEHALGQVKRLQGIIPICVARAAAAPFTFADSGGGGGGTGGGGDPFGGHQYPI